MMGIEDFDHADGRKISVGDCALFKPPQDSPPFIGIIRWLTLYRENNLQLGVNWLYRPIEVKLGKGILRDAAPNEVFYSFHKDEIPAASLLHPCKVAFLPKGVELPSGISSFVCHRVYDIANSFLMGTINLQERQEEVDQLLRKTQIEMHATVQPDGRSQKPLNGQTSTSLLKPRADNIQSASSPSHAKGKKRDRADQGSEPFKRERFSKMGDGDSVQFKPESILKSDISKITEKGGLVDSEGVEKLVQLMQLDGSAKKLELISRSMLAGVIAATENFDCLSRFVQLKGLTVLDEWLQDVHKGKIDHGSPKDGDKSVEEFLFVLLRSLGKLPVNLHALQMCNIGKSVNHLRSHKNLEIQKKARSLVDIWKKRVEAEMNVIDSKSGSTQAVSWATRSRLSEVSHGGNRHPGGSSEVAMKNSVTQLYASKPASVKAVQVEFTAKSTSSSPGPMKSALSPASGKDGQPRIVVGSTSDLPSTTAREERSSSSSQSHNNSQSCSSDHAKTTAFSGKEDARSSTAGSISVNKMSGSASRHRRLINGFSGPAVSGGQRETGSNRSSSLHRNSASEKFSQSGFTGEKALDVPIAEGNSHKLIVEIPKRGRSPAHSASGGSVEDPSIMTSRASSPVLSDKFDQYDRHSKDKSDANRVNTIFDVNTESWQSNDFKDVLTASDKGDGSPDAIPEERSRAGEEAAKLAAFSSSGNKLKSQNSLEASVSSMNALMESCVKYSKANASMLAGDNVGMNLLASVAAEEMSKSDLISPIDSPRRSTHMVEDCCTGDATKSKSSNVNNLAQEQSRSADGTVADVEQGVVSDNSYSWNELDTLPEQGSGDFSGDGKTSSSLPNGEGNECNSSNLQTSAEPCLEINVRSDEFRATAYLAVSRTGGTEKILDGEKSKLLHEKTTVASVDGIQDAIPMGSSSLLTEYNVKEATSSDAGERAAAAGSSSYESLEIDGEKKNNLSQGLNDCRNTEQAPPSVKVQSESLERSDEDLLHHSSSGSGKNLPPESEEKLSGGKDDEMGTRSHVKQKIDHGTNCAITNENQVLNGRGSAGSDQKSEGLEASVENKEVLEHSSGGVVLKTESSACPAQEVKQHMRSRESKMTGREANGTGESPSIAADAASGTSDRYTKLKFDLNEGFIADDGKYAEPVNFSGPGSSDFNPLPNPLTSVSTGLPASITVAAAAKGPFVPPEDLLRSKGELGWKGSAATSAFRPAEPRKVLEMPLGTTNTTLPNATAALPKKWRLHLTIFGNRDLARNDLMGSVPIRSSGGLDLDLNQVDETNDLGQYPASNIRRLDTLLLPVNSSSSGGFPNFEARRDFDLNNGPAFDEASAGPSSFSHYGRSSMQSQPHVSSLKMNNADMGTFSSWFTTGNAYPAVTIPSILADRGGNPFPIVATGGPPRMLGPATGGASFNPDIYRGSVLSSSPSVPFPSTPFQYPVYPFGAFPLPSANLPGGSTTYMDSSSSGRLFPAVNSQLLGPAATMSTPQYPRPYVVSFPDCSNNIGVDDNRKGSRHGLDLNSGPGSLDREGRDETSPLALRQLSVASSQALAEEQARMYHQLVGGIWKRKDPEGGWDADNFRHKQSSWQ
ncbi:protein SUO [Actinidia rufa]|uniref:Protein SUO n=1 Tax=Actinidia rufa TaxID=165716 RepID=A0A7J0GAH8_9ERIC|nr:protein SUO [Actinidia rufa]